MAIRNGFDVGRLEVGRYDDGAGLGGVDRMRECVIALVEVDPCGHNAQAGEGDPRDREVDAVAHEQRHNVAVLQAAGLFSESQAKFIDSNLKIVGHPSRLRLQLAKRVLHTRLHVEECHLVRTALDDLLIEYVQH